MDQQQTKRGELGYTSPLKGRKKGKEWMDYVRSCKPIIPLADRFWPKVDKSGGPDACWPFTGTITRCGYGRIWGEEGKNISAHQAAMKLAGVPLPPGMEWHHKCKNRACQNPSHIEAVTHAYNSLESDSPHALNAKKTHCSKGHEFTRENTAMYKHPKKGSPNRVCLTCHPNYWRHAIIPRPRPERSRFKATDADFDQRPCANIFSEKPGGPENAR